MKGLAALMKIDAKKMTARVTGWLIAALIVILGVVLMLSCWGIYTAKDSSPYSPEIIAQRFDSIAFLVYLTLSAVLFGVILRIVLPEEKRRPKAIRDNRIDMQKARLKAGSPVTPETQKEHRLRQHLTIGTAGIFALLMCYPAIYFLNSNHFTVESQNQDIAKAMTLTLIPGIIGLALCYTCSLLKDRSYLRETAIYKTIIQENKGQSYSNTQSNKHSGNKLVLIRCCVFVIAIAFIVVGIFNGGADDVLLKAIVICTECIGLG